MELECKGDSTGMIVSTGNIGSQALIDIIGLILLGDSLYNSSIGQFKFGRDTLYNLPTGTYDLHLYDILVVQKIIL